MALEASEIAVRVRLLGGSAYEKEARGVAQSTEAIGAAGKKADAALGATSLFSGAYGRKLDSIGSKMMSFGRTLTNMGIPIAALGYYAVKASTQFQASMMLLVTQANMPIKNLQSLTKEVLNLSSAVNQTPNNLAHGLYPIISTLASGKIKGNPIDLLRASAMGAGVGHDTVDAVAQALTSAMAAGFKGSPQKIVGLLDAAVGQGKMHMADITAAMNTGILPLAQLTGNSLPQILASTAALTKQGINASTVMSRMRLTFTSLVSPTAAGTKAMAALGFKNPFQLAEDMRSGGIIGMLNDLRMHTALFGGPNTTQSLNLIAQIFGKSRGIASIGSLLQAFPDIQSVYQNVLAYGNPQYLQTHFKQYQSTNAAKLAQAKANIDKGMIAFGDAINKYIVPTLGKLAEVAAKLLSGFGKLPGPLQELLLGLMALVVVGGPFFLFTGALVKGVGMIITGVAALTGMEGFGALAAGLTMTATSLALLAPAAAAAFAVFEVFTAKHGPAAKVRHAIKHAGYSAGHFLGKGIAGNLALFGIHGPESYYDVNDYLTGSAFKHLSPLLQGDVNALIGNHVSAGARLTTIERDLKQAGITSVDKIPGISDALKKAVKEGIKEVSLNVFLPNGKVLAQSVNDENRRNQNRR